MENIRQAVERAKARSEQLDNTKLKTPLQQPIHGVVAAPPGAATQQVELDPIYLQSHRIVAYDGSNPHSRPFDLLRTQVLGSMDLKGWKVLAVTSPTPNCGKTLTAVNLALSMARQSERQVCLVDLDLRKPQVANSLGLRGLNGVLDVVEGRADVDDATVVACVGSSRLEVLPTTACSDPSDLVASTAMRTFLQDLPGHGQSRIVILDLPPLLSGHDVISVLPQIDCVLLVAAVGTSKVSEIEECYKYLQSTNVVRVVLNKVPKSARTYAYY
jgi:Mrp family chromosome partitioning ATPase